MAKYRKHIENNKIVHVIKRASNLKNYRFVYKINFIKSKGNKDELIVICMNPSEADDKISDPTVNMLIEHAYQSGYKGMILFNVFPLYEPNSSKLPQADDYNNNTEYQTMMEKNQNFISCVLEKYNTNDILLAFGRPVRKYMKTAMEKIIDFAEESITKNTNKIVWKITGFNYYHHPKALPSKSRSRDKKQFILDPLNRPMLLNSKSSL